MKCQSLLYGGGGGGGGGGKEKQRKQYYFDVFSKVKVPNTEFVDQIKQMRRLVLVLAFQISYYFFYTSLLRWIC